MELLKANTEQHQLDVGFDEISLVSTVRDDEITREIEKHFDYHCESGLVREIIRIPTFPNEFQIGLIVGSSGSGKSTILRERFGEESVVEWDNAKAIASHFESIEDASGKFGAVGLNSIPSWLKPYNVLSNGERFRADLARRLKNGAVVDEFTSVVNREVAISCSMSIEKYIRRNNLHNIVFCSCHDDIIPYLKPDWVYNTDNHEFYNGRYLCRPEIHIRISSCSWKAWDMFRRHHYLSGDLNKSATCYLATHNDIPIAFAALLTLPAKGLVHAWKEHRIVVLPDYQGMGIGNKLSETLGQAYVEKGCRYFAKTSNPRMGEHRERSVLWKATTHNKKNRPDYLRESNNDTKHTKEQLEKHSGRVCYCHEYIGYGTRYPYTLFEERQKNEQITLF